MDFLANYGVEILLSLISAGALGFCKYLHTQAKQYKKLLEEKQDAEILVEVDKKIEPIYEELEELRIYIRKTETIEKEHMALIIASYRFRLVQLCKELLKAGKMTQAQYDQLTEFYRIYTGLGGNGQAKELYEKALALPIIEEE